MKRWIGAVLVLSLVLGGCSGWKNGSYSSVTPHEVKSMPQKSGTLSASTYGELEKALVNIVAKGEKSALLSVGKMDSGKVEENMAAAIRYVTTQDPVGTYAVSQITYHLGTSGGEPAISVSVEYIHDYQEIQKIKKATSMSQVRSLLKTALSECEAGVVIKVSEFEEMDLQQLVEDIMEQSPDTVMELPQVSVSLYPQTGSSRVMEFKFTYQNSREDLRDMRAYVEPVFASSTLYVSGEESQGQKYARLYTFLMERNDYKTETSITPTYSLLRHGVGDSKAVAVVYARMCRLAGLECYVVSGTRQGEPHFWNIICEGGVYYHVDARVGYVKLTDGDMQGYVWDYSAYPACGVSQQPADTEAENDGVN